MPAPDKGYVVTDENTLIMDFDYRDPMTRTDKPVAKAQPIWGRPSRAYSDPEVENGENVGNCLRAPTSSAWAWMVGDQFDRSMMLKYR